MKLKIEKWVEETRPFKESDKANEFFEESVRCYKIGAYKSAFIMSYLAFKLTLRNRILKCTYGQELKRKNPFFWRDEIIKKLENDDSWETHINTIVDASCVSDKDKTDLAILYFSDREQIKASYNSWRIIRNDCVHAKNKITVDNSTVECFWNFLIDNLSKFYVLGGKDYLLRELENLYKFYQYPEIVEHEKITSILSDVNVICDKNPKEFFQKLIKNIKIIAGTEEIVNDINKNFWRDILDSSHENIKFGIVEVISNDSILFFNFYNYYPQLLELSISLNPKFILNNLLDWLKDSLSYMSSFKKSFWFVLLELLDNYPKYVDINKVCNDRNIHLIKHFKPNEKRLRLLNASGVFKKYIFEISSWFFKVDADSQFINRYKYNSDEIEYIKLCFNYLEWDIECIKKINYTLSEFNFSMNYRSNISSKENGYTYKSVWRNIILENKDKISNVLNIEPVDCSEIMEILNNS